MWLGRDTGLPFELDSSDGLVENDSLGVTHEVDLWFLYLHVCTWMHTPTCIHTHQQQQRNTLHLRLLEFSLCISGLCLSDHLAKAGTNTHSMNCTLRHFVSGFTT